MKAEDNEVTFDVFRAGWFAARERGQAITHDLEELHVRNAYEKIVVKGIPDGNVPKKKA